MKISAHLRRFRASIPAVAALSLFILPAATTRGASIGWNYDGVGDDTLASTDVAGASGFAQDNWNNHAGAGQGPGAVPLNDLVDDTGATTTLDVTGWSLVTNNSWQHNQSANPNEKLMNSFNDTQPSLTFAQIPYALYDVVVYYGNNEGPSTSTLNVGAQSRTITTGNTAQSSYGLNGFLQGTDLNTATPTNYSVFNGLSTSTLTVSLVGVNNNGLSAIQIVEIPEPGSMALLGAGLFAIGLRRRKR